MLIQNSCLFSTIVAFLLAFKLLRSIYLSFSLLVNSDSSTDLTDRSVERGEEESGECGEEERMSSVGEGGLGGGEERGRAGEPEVSTESRGELSWLEQAEN